MKKFIKVVKTIKVVCEEILKISNWFEQIQEKVLNIWTEKPVLTPDEELKYRKHRDRKRNRRK